MGSTTAASVYCEHDEVQAACLECLAMPKKITPPPPSTPRATKNPSSVNDKISPLAGDLDMSMPVASVEKHLGSATLAARVFPHYLRRGGWLYLRCDDTLQARVKATKVIWEDGRTDLVDPQRDLGGGLAIEVDPKTWDDSINIDLGCLASRQRDGFRYLKTNDDDSVTHYLGGRPITDYDEIDLRD